MKQKLITGLLILAPFIVFYAAHLGLIAIGVSTNIAIALMLLAMGMVVIAIIAVIDTLRTDMKRRHEPAVHDSRSSPTQSDQ